MTCIKTGARVYFPQYDQVLAADLFQVNDAIVVRVCQVNALDLGYGFSVSPDTATHSVSNTYGGQNEFWRDDLGIFVVPIENLVTL